VAKKVLIVDDDVGITEVVGFIARQLGMDVVVLNTSLGVTEVFIDYQPDILIVDMIMPEKDGIDVLNEILANGIPVQIVLMSGLSEGYLRLAEAVAKLRDIEPVHILPKPFRHHELVELLTNIVNEKRLEAPPTNRWSRRTRTVDRGRADTEAETEKLSLTRQNSTPTDANHPHAPVANRKCGLPQAARRRDDGAHFVQLAAERAQESQLRQLDHELGVGIE
jgi:DNA-binding response OmpR family regulator